jgi:hypothetical protein
VPILLAPANNGLVTSYIPRLGWSNPVFANHYHLQVATDGNFNSLVIDDQTIVPSEYTPTSSLAPNTKFYWHVQTINQAGVTSAWSATRTFRTLLPAPVSLGADSSIQDLRPNLSWDMPSMPLPNPTSYSVKVSRNSSFTQIVSNVTVSGMSYTPGSDLPRNLTLYWRVRATGANGTSAWSGLASFSTGNPPSIPSLSSPADNALTTNYTPLLDWSNATVPSGTAIFDHYLLQVADSTGFSSPLIDQTVPLPAANSSFTPLDPLTSNSKYSWRVQACNSLAECSAWSSVRTFRTALPAPINLGTDGSVQDLRPSLSWNMPAYPLPLPTNYTVQVSKNSSFTQVVATGTAAHISYTPTSDLPRSLTLFWRVRANGVNGPSAWSDFSSFNTGSPPGTPNLLNPPSNTLVSSYTPLLDWSDTTIPKGAAAFNHYVLQIDDNADFSSPLVSQNGYGQTYNSSASPATALPPNTTYSWRVQACNTNAKCSAWSSPRTFRTKLTPPAALAPVGGVTVASLKPTFNWNPVSGAAGYTLEVSKASSFSTLLVNVAISKNASTYTPSSNLPAATPLFWRIRTNGSNGPSAWMAYESFSTP